MQSWEVKGRKKMKLQRWYPKNKNRLEISKSIKSGLHRSHRESCENTAMKRSKIKYK